MVKANERLLLPLGRSMSRIHRITAYPSAFTKIE